MSAGSEPSSPACRSAVDCSLVSSAAAARDGEHAREDAPARAVGRGSRPHVDRPAGIGVRPGTDAPIRRACSTGWWPTRAGGRPCGSEPSTARCSPRETGSGLSSTSSRERSRRAPASWQASTPGCRRWARAWRAGSAATVETVPGLGREPRLPARHPRPSRRTGFTYLDGIDSAISEAERAIRFPPGPRCA
jgi:hypothetical protein